MADDKSIKINGMAHKALELLKADQGIGQGLYASVVIVEAIERDYPHVYKALREWALRNQETEELQRLCSHDLRTTQ